MMIQNLVGSNNTYRIIQRTTTLFVVVVIIICCCEIETSLALICIRQQKQQKQHKFRSTSYQHAKIIKLGRAVRTRRRTLLYSTASSAAAAAAAADNNNVPSASLNGYSTSIKDDLLQNLFEVNTVYNSTSALIYDPNLDRYVKPSSKTRQRRTISTSKRLTLLKFFRYWIIPKLKVAFVPSGVTTNYYKFMTWRIIQRFVNANLNVFGTQSLLLGLGIKTTSNQLGALSATIQWVLKDALGKIVRMIWASKMSIRFDSDAKRWRMRSAFVFAVGNGLEITTYIIPSLFLLLATLANCCKQISMLTSSSTRSSISNSFRDGTRENISDITAKGEAQIAIVDLLGITSGVTISKYVFTTLSTVQSIISVYMLLQALEILCVYQQLRAVVYRIVNFERMVTVINEFCNDIEIITNNNNKSSNINNNNNNNKNHNNDNNMTMNGSKNNNDSNNHNNEKNNNDNNNNSDDNNSCIQTPQEMARTERIFLPPKHLSRRNIAFGSVGRTKLSPQELNHLIKIFENERFLLVVGTNVKHPRKLTYLRRKLFKIRHNEIIDLQENCHIILHSDATNTDIVKSTLALVLLRRKLLASSLNNNNNKSLISIEQIRTSDCYNIIQESLQEANTLFVPLLRQMIKKGWEAPSRQMFGRVKMRAEWPLIKSSSSKSSSTTDQKS